MQLGRGGECLACKGGSRTTNLNPKQPLIGMIFTNADPRYAGRLDYKQGGDTIVTMERVREAIAFNAELADESILLLLTSQMMKVAFITINSGLVPLIVGVCAQILYFGFEIIGGLRSHLLLVLFGRKNVSKEKAVSPRSHIAS